MWKFRLGLFLFCLAVLATSNIIYVVIETTIHHRHHYHNDNEDENLSLQTTINLNTRLRDLSSINLLQNFKQPCEDFYNYTCSSHGYLEDTLTHVRRDNRQRIDKLMKNKSMINDVTQLYTSCEVHKHLSSSSSSIVSVLLSNAATLRNYDDLAFLWGSLQLYDAITPLEFRMITNPWQTDYDLPTFEQSGIFDDASRLATEDHRLSIERRLLTIYQRDDAREWSVVIVDIEETLYSIFNENSDSFLHYLSTRGKSDLLEDWQPSISDRRFNITKYLVGCKPSLQLSDIEWIQWLTSRPLWCRAQTYISTLPSIISKYPLQAWMAYTKHAILLLNDVPSSTYGTSESLLTSVMPIMDVDHYANIDKDHLDCGVFVGEWLNAEVVELYSSVYGDQKIVEEIQDLALNLREKFVHLLHAYKELQEKVASITLSVGRSRERKQNRTWTMNNSTFVDNLLRLKRDRLSSRFFNRETPILPLHIGARYRHQVNTLDISIGLLREPLYTQDKSRLYAQLATIIGHELAHSIDGIGVNFDKYGNYNPMTEQTTSLVASILSSTCVFNQEQQQRTQNEDYADMLGVNLAYWALMSTPESNDEDRRTFFETYALRFCHRPLTDYEHLTFIHKSTHSLSDYRVNNVLKGNDDFNALYTCNNDNSCIKLY